NRVHFARVQAVPNPLYTARMNVALAEQFPGTRKLLLDPLLQVSTKSLLGFIIAARIVACFVRCALNDYRKEVVRFDLDCKIIKSGKEPPRQIIQRKFTTAQIIQRAASQGAPKLRSRTVSLDSAMTGTGLIE